MATKNFIEELEWRGMIHTIMPGAKEQLEKELTTAYLGIDPTADSLHIGHLCGVMMLRHLQRCGHKPLARSVGAKRYDDKDTGEAKGIGFKFAKHGIYVHYGVGRGYVYSNGTVVRAQRIRKGDALWYQHLAKGYTRKEIAKKYVAGSGEIRRKPVDWLDSVLKSSIGELADIVCEYHGDKAMEQILEVLDRATIGVKS